MVKEKKNKIGWWVILAVVIIVILATFVILLSQGEENYTSGDERTTKINALDCANSNTQEAFFSSDSAQRYTHEIRATFRNDRIENIAYIYEGTYSSTSAAESASATLHADYNIYMGGKKANPESLNPNFSDVKSKLKITLYADKKKIDEVTAKLFFLNENEARDIDTYTAEKLEELYEGKGFSCTYKE